MGVGPGLQASTPRARILFIPNIAPAYITEDLRSTSCLATVQSSANDLAPKLQHQPKASKYVNNTDFGGSKHRHGS